MNALIAQHFDAVETRLIESSAVTAYEVLRREIAPSEGKVRVKVTLSDSSIAELFAYVSESNGQVYLLKYSFHWQDAEGTLRERWDNAPHYPMLPNAPHHAHDSSGIVRETIGAADIFAFIEMIEKALR